MTVKTFGALPDDTASDAPMYRACTSEATIETTEDYQPGEV